MNFYDLVIAERDHKIIEFGKRSTLEQRIEHMVKEARYLGAMSVLALAEVTNKELYETLKNVDANLLLDILQLKFKAQTGDTQRL